MLSLHKTINCKNMKTQFRRAKMFLLLSGLLLLTGSFTDSYSYFRNWDYIPIFMKRTDLDNSVSYRQSAREIENPGKIYYKPPYIFMNERYKGVHVINNSDPYYPVNEGFIVAPGCIDMAVKGSIMYLDNAVDLVAIDLVSKQVTKRIKQVFPEPLSPSNQIYNSPDESGYVVVGWVKNPNK
jgi:hypothetical protein